MLFRSKAGIFDLTPVGMGIFSGATLHEVAHTVGAGNAMGRDIANVAIIVKMIRVMMLVPLLIILSFLPMGNEDGSIAVNGVKPKKKIDIPWFAIGFLVVICFNSFIHLPAGVIEIINDFDTFFLTMAMVALGAETSFDKFKKAGAKPFILSFILYAWLLIGGYYLVKILSQYAG